MGGIISVRDNIPAALRAACLEVVVLVTVAEGAKGCAAGVFVCYARQAVGPVERVGDGGNRLLSVEVDPSKDINTTGLGFLTGRLKKWRRCARPHSPVVAIKANDSGRRAKRGVKVFGGGAIAIQQICHGSALFSGRQGPLNNGNKF